MTASHAADASGVDRLLTVNAGPLDPVAPRDQIAALCGTTGTAQTFASSQTSPYWIGALRLVIASAFFACVVLLGRSRRPQSKFSFRAAWPWVLLGGVSIAAYNLCFFAGVKATGVATGTGISFLLFNHALRQVSAATCVTLSLAEPVTAFVLAIIVVGEQPKAAAFWGLGLVVAGLLLVVWGETSHYRSAKKP